MANMSVSPDRRWAIFKRDGYRCAECASDTDLTVDHVVPRSAGGSDLDENLQTLCRRCNASKKDRVKPVGFHRGPTPVLVTVRVPVELRDAFNTYAKGRGKSVAELLRGVMERAVES